MLHRLDGCLIRGVTFSEIFPSVRCRTFRVANSGVCDLGRNHSRDPLVIDVSAAGKFSILGGSLGTRDEV